MPARFRLPSQFARSLPTLIGLIVPVLASIVSAVPIRNQQIAELPWWTPAADFAIVYGVDVRGVDANTALLANSSGELATGHVEPSLALLGHREVLSVDAQLDTEESPSSSGSSNSWFAMFRLILSTTFLLKCGCIASNLLFQVSPLPIVKRFASSDSTGDSDSAPFVSQMYCTTQFAFYGFLAYIVTRNTGFLVLVYSNLVGIVMGVYYVFVFLRHCKNPDVLRLTSKYLIAVGSSVILQVSCLLMLPTNRALLVIGTVASTCSLISALSLVTALPTIIQTRCSRGLHKPLLLAAEVNGLLWVTTGLTLWDFYIFVPNVVCVTLNTVALTIAWYFPEDDMDSGKRKGSDVSSCMSYGAAGETGGTPCLAVKEPRSAWKNV